MQALTDLLDVLWVLPGDDLCKVKTRQTKDNLFTRINNNKNSHKDVKASVFTIQQQS